MNPLRRFTSSFAAGEIVEERHAVRLCPHADVAAFGKRVVLHFEQFAVVERDREQWTCELGPQPAPTLKAISARR